MYDSNFGKFLVHFIDVEFFQILATTEPSPNFFMFRMLEVV
jgi:hypothetical protein